MAYIRSKTVKGDKYLYLVKSIWDSKKNTSRQEIIKYLGKASQVTADDIPIDYRDNPKIAAYISAHAGQNIEKTQKMIDKLKDHLFASLTQGDLDKSIDIFESYSKHSGLSSFFDNMLKPAMYKVGELWENNKLSIGTEHVATNIARELVGIIDERNKKLDKKAKVLLCTPSGEEHALGCCMIQSFLQSKGYRVFNLAPSAPAEAILHFINEEEPDIVLVSITIEDNVKPGQRLVSKIKSNGNIPVLIGGQAVCGSKYKFDGEVITEPTLEKIPKLIKQHVK